MDERLLNEVVQRLTRIEVKLEEIVTVKADVEELKKEIIELKTKDEQQRKELDNIAENNKWISRAVIGAIISSLVALLFTLVKLGLKI